MMAQQMEAAGNYDEAFECWRNVPGLDSDPYLLCKFGRLAMQLDKEEEAERSFLSASNLAPELSIPYECLGTLYLKQGQLESARNYFKKSLTIKESARTLNFLGIAENRLGLTLNARESFAKAMSIDPCYEEAYYNLAITFTDDQPTEAVKLLQKSLEIDPDYPAANRELGWCLRRLWRLSEGLPFLRKAIELDSEDGWTNIYLGNTLWVTGNLLEAEDFFQKAVKVWPDDAIGYWCLALFYEYQGMSEKAAEYYQKGLETDPDDEVTNLQYGIFLGQIGEYSKARIHLERVLSMDPDNERARMAMSSLK